MSYYNNSTSTFQISLTTCGDVSPNPGPHTECKKQYHPEHDSQNMTDNGTRIIGTAKLHDLDLNTTMLNNDVWNRIHQLGIFRKRKIHRGTKGRGRLRQDRQALPIPIIIKQRKKATEQTRTVCRQNLKRVKLVPTPVAKVTQLLPSVYVVNPQSLNNKLDEFYAVTHELQADIISVSETWFQGSDPANTYHIPEYQVFSKGREGRRGGGVATYVKYAVNPKPVEIAVPQELEVVWVQIRPKRLPRTVSSIFVATVYSPPNMNNDTALVTYLTEAADDIFRDHPGAGIIISGDMNRLNLSTLLTAHRLKQVVDKPTRHNIILDKIVTNLKQFYHPVELIAPIGQSDHNGILLKPKILPPHQNKTKIKQVRPMRESSIRSFGNWITQHDWSSVLNAQDVNEKCDSFYSELDPAIDNYFPLKSVRLHDDDKPWMTTKIKCLIRQRQRLFNFGSPDWTQIRNQIQREIEQAKIEFHHNRVHRLKQENPSSWYRYIKLMTSNKSTELQIDVPGVDEDDHIEVATAINTHLVKVAEDIPPLSHSSLPAYLPLREASAPKVHLWQVYHELRKTKVGKSCGPDGISSRLIREFALELTTPICDIINASLDQGIVPHQWKMSTIVPIPKTSPPSIDKLRPIALTSHFAKLAELFVCKMLLADISGNIDHHQYGNRPGMSTSHYLVDLLEYLYSHADKTGYTSTVVMTDFSKAFDLVDHNIAIQKIYALGARPELVPWVSSFLSERTQQVRYRGKLSEPVVTNAGVPQGTRLGPILFLAVVNDALDESTLPRWKYVDDLTIAESRKPTTGSNISQTVRELEAWCESTRMKLNPAKCQFLKISFSRQPADPEPVIIANQSIPECDHVKLLGVTIQNDLKWKNHVCDLVSRSSRKLYMLRTLKKFGLLADDLLTVFQCYIRPITEYCAPVWHSSLTLAESEQIESIQKRALRIILGPEYQT